MRWTALIWALLLCVVSAPVLAQDIDDLEDLDEGVVLEEPFVHGIQPNTWGLSILFGYLDVSKTLLQAQGIVVDVEFPDEASFADMNLKGSQSFSPQLRLTRTIGSHFGLETGVGFALGDYEQTLTTPLTNWVDPEGDNEVTEQELQKGSYWMWNLELSAVWYPRGEGTVQPYLIGGGGATYFDIDSVYIDGGTPGLNFSYGVGLKIIGDELYSIRIEVRNYHNNLTHETGSVFRTLPNLSADRLVDFPVSRLENIQNLTDEEIAEILRQLDLDPNAVQDVTVLPVPYSDYKNEAFSSLWFSLGFEATF